MKLEISSVRAHVTAGRFTFECAINNGNEYVGTIRMRGTKITFWFPDPDESGHQPEIVVPVDGEITAAQAFSAVGDDLPGSEAINVFYDTDCASGRASFIVNPNGDVATEHRQYKSRK